MTAPPHRPKKRFGQHFLTDPAVIAAIVAAIDPLPEQPLVEIGPGLSALTRPLVERAGRLTVIELDRDLARRLQADARLRVLQADVLGVDFSQLAAQLVSSAQQTGLRVVGNLPYNISTPILFHLIGHVDAVCDQHFMLQREVVERIVATPCTSAYGRISIMLQWRYTMEQLFTVPPGAFEPPPQVNSAVLRMVPRNDFAKIDTDRLREIVQVAFSQRRKLLRHTLGRWLDAQKNFNGDFDTQRRAEEVSVAEYIALTQQIFK